MILRRRSRRAARPGRRIAAGFLVVVATLPGCAFLGDADGAADAARIRALLDGGLAGTVAPPRPGEVLDVRRSLVLANRNDEALAAEGEVWVRSLVERQRAVASFLPRLRFGPSLSFRDQVGTEDRTTLDAPLEGSWSLDPVANVAELRRADLSGERRRALLLAAQDDVLLGAARAHLAVWLAERRADVLRTSLRLQEARVADVRARRDAGLRRDLDVTLAESRAADARGELAAAERDVTAGRAVLAFVTGADVTGVVVSPDLGGATGRLPPPPDEPERLVARAIRRRTDVRAADAAVAEACARTERAWGGYWPSVSLELDAFLSKESDPTDLDWSSVLRLDVPLLTAGLVEADIREALSAWRQANLVATRLRRAIRRDVLAAHAGVEAASRRREAAVARQDAARRASELAEAQSALGLATELERLTAQDEALRAGLDLAAAETDVVLRHLELLRAVGAVHTAAGLVRAEDDHAETR